MEENFGLNELGKEDVSYNVPVSMRLWGDLNLPALEAALHEIRKRHDILRATFALSSGQLVQRTTPHRRLSISLIDLWGLPSGEVISPEHEAARLWDQEAKRRFDLERGPLMRVALLRLARREHLLLATFHHIVIDAWSIDIFARELETIYQAASAGIPSPISPLKLRFADFAERQRRWLREEDSDRQLQYWTKRLAGAPEILTFPTDRPRPSILGSEGSRLTMQVEESVVTALRALARREAATSFMVLLAVFEVLLRRFTGQQDLVVGTPIANRHWREAEDVIGLFLNTVVLRVEVLGNPSFGELLKGVRETSFEAYDNQHLPFEKLVEELRPGRNLSYSPMFQILFVHRLSSAGEEEGLIREVQIGSVGAKFDMTFSFLEMIDSLLLVEVEYNKELFDDSTAQRLLSHLLTLLQGVAENPLRPVLDFDLFGQAERHLLRNEWNDTQKGLEGTLVIERFLRQAQLTPTALSVVGANENLTYEELDSRSGQLARRLAARGIGPETPVVLLLNRRPALLTAILAVLRAGGAYVPLDTDTPAERITKILDDLSWGYRGPFLLTEDRLIDHLPQKFQMDTSRCISLDVECAVLEGGGGRVLTYSLAPQNLAYILYTSGTSGVPKGVAVEHRSVAAFLDWAAASYGPTERRSVLAATPLTFDLSVFELFLPLTTGGCVILRDPLTLLEQGLETFPDVSLINTVPSLLENLLETSELPESVATVNLAGEVLRLPVVNSVLKAGTVHRLVNLYGPTESTVYATAAEVFPEEKRDPSLGRPIRNTQAYVVNELLELQPIGAPGELVLGGEGLARGYWNRPNLTAGRFTPNPFGGAGTRLYRTGDMVRWLPDGKLEFLGRLDRQVKIRGLRIELGDVEASLLRHAGVREATVVAMTSPQGEPHLVAYVRPRDGEGELRGPELRAFLQQRLPRGLVPSAIVIVKEIPRTTRGKIDFKGLSQPDWSGEEAVEFIPPRSAAERQLAEIWTEVLGIRYLSANDNFFERGGHSLHAAKVVARLKQVGVELSLRRIFDKPRLGELAREIEERHSERELEKVAASIEQDSGVSVSVRKEAGIETFILGEDALSHSESAEITDLLGAVLEEKASVLKRRSVIRFPANCTVNVPAALHFQLVTIAPVDPLLQRLARLRVLRSACVETLFVKVTSPSFRVSPHLARVQVPVDGDSELVAFKMVPLETGLHVVEIEVFAGANRVGYFILETEADSYVN